jgi:hypothetical protein
MDDGCCGQVLIDISWVADRVSIGRMKNSQKENDAQGQVASGKLLQRESRLQAQALEEEEEGMKFYRKRKYFQHQRY